MFEDFHLSMIDTGEATLRVRYGGKGPPLLLLHGHPRTHVMWHKIAPRLATEFTVIMPDSRGYGQSSKPPTTHDHEPYSKRAMARDAVALMRHFGFEQFYLAGHDRGARVAYRTALDHPTHILKLAVLDILSTIEHWQRIDQKFGGGWWHWMFLAQPFDLPERLISADPDYYYWRRHGDTPPAYIDREAFEDYRRAFTNPATIHAMCEDYRAGATIDIEIDQQDQGNKKISCPVLALWSKQEDLEECTTYWVFGASGQTTYRDTPLIADIISPKKPPMRLIQRYVHFLRRDRYPPPLYRGLCGTTPKRIEDHNVLVVVMFRMQSS